jgi:hypothetical protein
MRIRKVIDEAVHQNTALNVRGKVEVLLPLHRICKKIPQQQAGVIARKIKVREEIHDCKVTVIPVILHGGSGSS